MHVLNSLGQTKEIINAYQGATGPQGAIGPQGATGAQGPSGAVGITGPAGVNGTGTSNIGCRVTHNANQACADSSNTTLAFNTESYDSDTMHDTVTNNSRITIKTAGKYYVYACVAWTSNATGRRALKFWVNGDSSQQFGFDLRNTVSGNTFYQWAAFAKNFAVNDYIQCIMAHDAGTSLNCLTGGVFPAFGARKMY